MDLYRSLFRLMPAPVLLLSTDLVIEDASARYLEVLGRTRGQLVGRPVFDAFPLPDGQAPEENALWTSLQTVLATSRAHEVPLLDYAIEAVPGSGETVHRAWSIANVPVLNPATGRLVGILNAVDDITETVHHRTQSELATAMADDLRRRTEVLSGDVQRYSTALGDVREQALRSGLRLAALAEAALQVAAAETVEELTDAVVARGLAVFGADGGALAVQDADPSMLRLHITESLGEGTRQQYGRIPLAAALPAAAAARTGEPVLLGDRAAGLAFSAEMAAVYRTAGRQAWASFPLVVGAEVLGSLTASWDTEQDFGTGDVELLRAFAAQCALALQRLLHRQAERDAARTATQLTARLQMSLLSPPAQPDHLEVAVRYTPAVQNAGVGGDWYDCFLLSDGSTLLTLGDVTGHDLAAVVHMAQVRNVLRGVAHVKIQPPAGILTALDRALRDLDVGTFATAVVAKVEQTGSDAAAGVRTLRWSNAGHLPPLLLHPEHGARLLDQTTDPLLGIDHPGPRQDHTVTLEPGSTVVLYTDGLIERRGRPLTDGLAELVRTADVLARQQPPLERLCDSLLARLGRNVEDDVALLALRAHPETGPGGS